MTAKKKILVSLVVVAFIAIIAYGIMDFINKPDADDEQAYQTLLSIFTKYDAGALTWVMPYMPEVAATASMDEYYTLAGKKSKAGDFVATAARKYSMDAMRKHPGFEEEFIGAWHAARDRAALKKAKG